MRVVLVMILTLAVHARAQMMTTSWSSQTQLQLLAGQTGGVGSADRIGTAAHFSGPNGVAIDSTGNVYVADFGGASIRKITSSGVVTTLAGSDLFGSTNGTGAAARFSNPPGVAVDSSGTVFVADGYNNKIRKITPSGVVTTFAGSSTPGSTDGTGAAALFNNPQGIAVDSSGVLYVADGNNHTIRKITTGGVVTTLAGSAGASGSTDGTGLAAQFNTPAAVAVDSSGTVYVADEVNCTIRKVSAVGVVTTLAGSPGTCVSTDGSGSSAGFTYPVGVTVDASGFVFVADGSSHTIRKITPGGVVTTLAGSTGSSGFANGTGAAAKFSTPSGLVVDGSGTLYVGDMYNYSIRKVSSTGDVTTFAGSAGATGFADGPGSAATFFNLQGSAIDSSANVYVTDKEFSTIRKITPAGVVTTFAGTAGNYGSSDGTGAAASFTMPIGLTIDSSGNLYVIDSNNCTIRKITPAAVVTTFAGSAGNCSYTDGTGSAASFTNPTGIGVDLSGNVYVSDSNMIRKITSAGVVTTFAGTAGLSGTTNGTGAAARFNGPGALAVDGSGNIYAADGNMIRKITPGAVVSTFAGSTTVGSKNGTGTVARFYGVGGMAVDGSGNIYVADTNNQLVRKMTAAAVVTTVVGNLKPGVVLGNLPAQLMQPSSVAVSPSSLVITTYQGVLKTSGLP